MRKENSPNHNLAKILNKPILRSYSTHKEAVFIKNENIWEKLNNISLLEIVLLWTSSLNYHTARSYKGAFFSLEKIGLISLDISLQEFAMLNHNLILDSIKQIPTHQAAWSEGTKQVRAASYISLTKFLNRITSGIIPVALPSRQEATKTFYKIRDLVKTKAMNQEEIVVFLEKLKQINHRDWLIAQTLLQGAKRAAEALSITTDQISFEEGTISFIQVKNKKNLKITVITYPQRFMQLIKNYIGNRNGLVFITKTGKSVDLKQLAGTFAKAGSQANIPFKVTPHVLRATAVTEYKRMGCSDSDIMKVTGHSSSKMIHAYDKSIRSENASKKISLI
ncbi:phage integrase family protein [Chlamydia avium]|uniref:Phage integrase family protein n=1 Tax=Chlamydia avium TaxID=1457141 RepID=A0ABN0MRC2_9CHLA|nr:phage integrase family protein [Chlamydia avium]